MGVYRVFLAICVLLVHVGFVKILDADWAVQNFFIISGFYMAMILDTKYLGKLTLRDFYLSRFVRIFPMYWLVLLFGVLISSVTLTFFHVPLAFSKWVEWGKLLSFHQMILLGLSNIFIFGQDLFLFLKINVSTGYFEFSKNFRDSEIQIWKLFLVPPAWSLSLELAFYAVAPFLIKINKKYLLLLMITSLAFRFLLQFLGYSSDPWNARFFPTELAFFILGIFSYSLYNYLIYIKYKKVLLSACSLGILMSVMVVSNRYYVDMNLMFRLLFHFMTAALVPLLFILTKKNIKDRKIGEFSYPIYLSHWYVVLFYKKYIGDGTYLHLIGMIIVTLIVSSLLMKMIEPVENYRTNLKSNKL